MTRDLTAEIIHPRTFNNRHSAWMDSAVWPLVGRMIMQWSMWQGSAGHRNVRQQTQGSNYFLVLDRFSGDVWWKMSQLYAGVVTYRVVWASDPCLLSLLGVLWCGEVTAAWYSERWKMSQFAGTWLCRRLSWGDPCLHLTVLPNPIWILLLSLRRRGQKWSWQIC